MTHVQDSDESLMSRYQSGDEDAFRIIFDRYTISLIHFAYRFLGSQVEAEDIAQEVFLRVYRHKEQYDAQRPFRSWIFSITARLSANKVRDRKTHRETTLDAEDSDEGSNFSASLIDQGPQPEHDYQSQESVQRILAALQMLPENQRTAILLCRFEQMTYEEIANVLGTSIQAVKSLIYRGMQTLSQRLQASPTQL